MGMRDFPWMKLVSEVRKVSAGVAGVDWLIHRVVICLWWRGCTLAHYIMLSVLQSKLCLTGALILCYKWDWALLLQTENTFVIIYLVEVFLFCFCISELKY